MNMSYGGLRFMRAASIMGVVLVAVAFGTRTSGQYPPPPPKPCGVPYEVQLDVISVTGCKDYSETCGVLPSGRSCEACDGRVNTDKYVYSDLPSAKRYVFKPMACPGIIKGVCKVTGTGWFGFTHGCIPVATLLPIGYKCGMYDEADRANSCNPL
jgi:hypothetical protein